MLLPPKRVLGGPQTRIDVAGVGREDVRALLRADPGDLGPRDPEPDDEDARRAERVGQLPPPCDRKSM